jgi:CBS domain-containing protein
MERAPWSPGLVTAFLGPPFDPSRVRRLPAGLEAEAMKAGDVMTSAVISAAEDTPVGDIAQLLLQNHISAIPILDKSGAPIGMVSEGDLVGRDETQRDARREWWLAIPAESQSISPDFLSGLRHPERAASDIMSRPVITVDEDTDTGEIARLLAAHRIKRVPVVRNGQVVGIVSRENLLRMLASEERPHDVKSEEGLVARALGDVLAPLKWRFERPHHKTEPHAEMMTEPNDPSSAAADFRRLAAAFESTEAHRREDLRHSAGEERQHRAEELIGKHISDGSWRHLVHDARTAAEQGQKEFLLLRFPSQVCSDGGRAVNVPDPGWPVTLRGEAAEIYSRWSHDLQPQGFHLSARVVDFPDGMPGDIGMFLVWG